MSNAILKKDNILLSSFEDMWQICTPLKKHFHVDNFSYIKIFPDMSRMHLDTNAAWSCYFYEKVEEYYKHHMNGNYHWETGFSPILTLNEASTADAIAHGMGEGIFFSKHLPDGSTELIYISHDWHSHKDSKLQLLLSHIDVLENFIDYFKETAADMITAASNDPITYSFLKPRNNERKQLPYYASCRDAFYRDLTHLRSKQNLNSSIHLLDNGKLSLGKHYNGSILSCREHQLMRQLVRGKKPKQIQEELNIKKSTYDSMIKRIQLKMHCHSRNEIIYSTIDSGLIHHLLNN